jgi:hypothetical protein
MSTSDPLIDFVSSVSGEAYLKVEESLGDGYVRLRTSEAERRQAKHDIRGVEDIVVELLRNARDAHAQRVYIASAREGDRRSLTMIDDGVGVPNHLHGLIFEPRVTSKLETMVMDRWGVHGRGMALYSIGQNVVHAGVAASAAHKGTAITIVTDTTQLPERTDQSTWPMVELDETGRPHVARGPHNIIRRVVEFACEHPELEVYYGTPTEILSTLHLLGRERMDTAELMFCDDLDRLHVWLRPAACDEAMDLVDAAASIGVHVSERTAHRILAGELAALEPVATQAQAADEPERQAAPDIYRDRRTLRIAAGDLARFKAELEHAFDAIAEKYYLNLCGEPRVSIGSDEIRVRFSVEKED